MTKNKKKKDEYSPVMIGFACILIAAVIIVPNTVASYRQNGQVYFAPTTAWLETCDWLRNRTPEPFVDGYYYKLYGKAEWEVCTGTDIVRMQGIGKLNKNAYRVLSWWDYGHWIVRIGQRPVVCSPAGGFTMRTASILVNQDEDDATRICMELYVRYIVIDYMMVGPKWYAMPLWAGKDYKQDSDEYKNSFVVKLWENEGSEHWEKVWQSTTMYGNHAQIKVFELKGVR